MNIVILTPPRPTFFFFFFVFFFWVMRVGESHYVKEPRRTRVVLKNVSESGRAAGVGAAGRLRKGPRSHLECIKYNNTSQHRSSCHSGPKL